MGHLDYIRTVQFHPNATQFDWILSASDDQTLRLWDFKKRTNLSVLTGHNHYVMCASFHPSDDLIVSASLDQTVRVWDTTGLRHKQQSGEGSGMPGFMSDPNMMMNRPNGPGAGNNNTPLGNINVNGELFGSTDVVVKYVLEGHDRGVNWAAFHPTLPLLVSAADDRQLKLWRMSESKAWEVDTLRGHANNVSCCLFHPKHDLVVSNSEDRSIRVWDVSKRVIVRSFRREGDRFWILAAHRNQNLLAAGHDTGMSVFKLERERPASTHGSANKLYYVRGRELFCRDYSRAVNGGSGIDIPVASLRRVGSQSQTDGIGSAPRHLAYNAHNPTEGNVLVYSDIDGGTYELVTFSLNNSSSGSVTDGKRGACLGPAVFLGRNRFAVLDRATRQIVIKNLNNETTKRVQAPIAHVDLILDGGASGRLLLVAEDRIILMEVQSRRVLGELSTRKIKSVVWSPDGSKAALLSKCGIIIVSRQLEQLCSIHDTVRIKSGAWDISPGGTANELFLYTTVHHVKYCLPTGDTGTIRTLDSVVYAQRVLKDQLFCLDKEARARVLSLDTTEARFKWALTNKKYGQVMQMVRHSRLCGRAIVRHLQAKGFPEVALHFVKEPKTKFRLALACGNIEAAMECAFTLEQQPNSDPKTIWGELGNEALRQGNHQVVEMSYQRTKDFDRLSFLYLISGDTEKLRKMMKIATMRQDIMGRYHNALLLGDAVERIKVLDESGNRSLAYLSAKIHGLEEEAKRLQIAIETNGGTVEGLMDKLMEGGGKLLQPPTPIVRANNWATLPVKKTTLEDLQAAEVPDTQEADDEPVTTGVSEEDETAWDEDLDGAGGGISSALDDLNLGDDDGMGDWGDDLDLGDDVMIPNETKNTDMEELGEVSDEFQMPTAGRPPAGCWVANSSHAADHMAAGGAASAMQLLSRQIAASDFESLSPAMVGCYLGATCSMPGIPGSGSMSIPLLRNDASGHPGSDSLPRLSIQTKDLVQGIRGGYRFFQGGKFNDSLSSFQKVLLDIPLVRTSSKQESNEVKEMVEICREYITAIRIKAVMSAHASDPKRSTELSAYFTHCNLQPVHLLLALRSAMGTAFKHKNFIVAASFAQRLLELPDMSSERNADLRVKAGKVLQKSEAMARNECGDLNYDPFTAFLIDAGNLTPIVDESESIKCSYCGSVYSKEAKGKKCETCSLSIIGVETIGLVTGF